MLMFLNDDPWSIPTHMLASNRDRWKWTADLTYSLSYIQFVLYAVCLICKLSYIQSVLHIYLCPLWIPEVEQRRRLAIAFLSYSDARMAGLTVERMNGLRVPGLSPTALEEVFLLAPFIIFSNPRFLRGVRGESEAAWDETNYQTQWSQPSPNFQDYRLLVTGTLPLIKYFPLSPILLIAHWLLSLSL